MFTDKTNESQLAYYPAVNIQIIQESLDKSLQRLKWQNFTQLSYHLNFQ